MSDCCPLNVTKKGKEIWVSNFDALTERSMIALYDIVCSRAVVTDTQTLGANGALIQPVMLYVRHKFLELWHPW